LARIQLYNCNSVLVKIYYKTTPVHGPASPNIDPFFQRQHTVAFNAHRPQSKMASRSISQLRQPPLFKFNRNLRLPLLSNAAQSRLLHTTSIRRADTIDPKKPIILEQPDKFRPPSHPARLRKRKPRMYYGRDLTDEDKAELNAKPYPYAFPPKETFMHWFLTNRSIHLWITLVRPILPFPPTTILTT